MLIAVCLMNKQPHFVLAGGGHSNLLALRALAKKYRVTLVSDNPVTAYSGVLPGYLCGQYSKNDLCIDLPKLAKNYGVAWRLGQLSRVRAGRLWLADGDEITFDALSINTGATARGSSDSTDNNDNQPVQAVRPILSFIRWVESITAIDSLCIVGAGAGAVELALTLRARWRPQLPKITVIGRQFLADFPPPLQRHCRECLQKNNIDWVEGTATVTGATVSVAKAGKTQTLTPDKIILADGVAAPAWLSQSGLHLTADGYIAVNECLQSFSASNVFAAGDVAGLAVAKAGVMATRQAPTLIKNMVAVANGKQVGAWHHRDFPLYILNTADGRAVASYRHLTFSGRWVWHWKNYLDCRYINLFR